ncbi:hypothetical protein ABID56_001074 [Alkalibacillus flavidus]|uniref:DUF115 domain-containing protein n=1 Tax=Alkalibacillus flavidus TaxID=546021 RepID=A0ABV2KTS5_9BACI
MLRNNERFLKNTNPHLLHNVKDIKSSENVVLEPAKNDGLTVKIEDENQNYNYIHSKYNPVREAKTIIDRYEEELKTKDNVMIYGLGMGYHVEELKHRYPKHKLFVYEPNSDVFSHLVNNRNLDRILGTKDMLSVGFSAADIKKFLQEYIEQLNVNTTFIVLPSYERLYQEEYNEFIHNFIEAVKAKRITNITNYRFEKNWTINSLKNLKYTLNTPNVLSGANVKNMKQTPTIIVAAGPSLNREINTLKYIKENSLANIYSVGSAINTLVDNDIIPDAVFTYDPQDHNHRVYQKAIEKGVDKEVLMVFGSSVGYKTLEYYRGPKFHVLTSQDTVTKMFLDVDYRQYGFVSDSPSIAVITLQILGLLESSPIIFVGQNLGYVGNEHYADGIQYGEKRKTLNDNSNTLIVKGTQGQDIVTTDSFNRMRQSLEYYIGYFIQEKNIQFINTTVEGAHIEGTRFEYLENVISDLSPISNSFVDSIEQKNELNLSLSKNELLDLKDSFDNNLGNIAHYLDRLNEQVERMRLNQIDQTLKEIDKTLKNVNLNSYYQHIIAPMIRVQNEIVNNKIRNIDYSQNDKRGAEVYQLLSKHLELMSDVNNEISEHFYETIEELSNEGVIE